MVGAARVLEISCKVVLLVKFSDAKLSATSRSVRVRSSSLHRHRMHAHHAVAPRVRQRVRAIVPLLSAVPFDVLEPQLAVQRRPRTLPLRARDRRQLLVLPRPPH